MEFLEAIKEAVKKVREYAPREVVVVHHDDADGICSGAIMKACLEREGFRPRLICLEKAFPEVLERLQKSEGNLIFYVDIGTAHADKISRYNQGRNLTIILDHHDPVPSEDPLVLNVNPEFYGMEGESDASGATVTYLFAREMDEANKDLAHLAVVGSYEIPGPPRSLNELALKDAIEAGKARKSGKQIIVSMKGMEEERGKISSLLTLLGSVGYYVGGPEKAVNACLEGFDESVLKLSQELKERRNKARKRGLAFLFRGGMKKLRYTQWFNVGNMLKGMGTKVIGTICSSIANYRKLVDPDKYLVGIMAMLPEIPGFGALSEQLSKASIRVPQALRKDCLLYTSPSPRDRG